ncbi:Ig-like domain-containing protein [Paucilactobacillus oligofermentans]|uniref:Ig-like domain-containing protein n=1 Tax=Paucilactobacillus oligofermentans TaxID=293371 RepID=UPI00138F4248|nr:Ig-like domain-containing protein [Paucilactobacillus oligofermentans]
MITERQVLLHQIHRQLTAPSPTNSTPDTSTIPVPSVTLDKDDVSIKVGGTAKLTPTINPANATDKTGKWSVTDDSIATVGNDGTVTGVKVVTTIVTFATTDGNKTAQATVTVTAA